MANSGSGSGSAAAVAPAPDGGASKPGEAKAQEETVDDLTLYFLIMSLSNRIVTGVREIRLPLTEFGKSGSADPREATKVLCRAVDEYGTLIENTSKSIQEVGDLLLKRMKQSEKK